MTTHEMMRSRSGLRAGAAGLGLTAAILLLAGCGEGPAAPALPEPEPVAAQPAEPETKAEPDYIPGGSASVYGKARDRAVDLQRKVNERDEKALKIIREMNGEEEPEASDPGADGEDDRDGR